MATATGIWNQAMAAANPLAETNAKSNGATTSGSTTGAASTISSNDFLTLLVTEMKNQDPTANNDPNQYINQLVQVNSLEQLIDINQNLTTALGTTATPPVSGKSVHAASSTSAVSRAAAKVASPNAGTAAATSSASTAVASNHSLRAGSISGNLSIPNATPAASRVAQALSGRH